MSKTGRNQQVLQTQDEHKRMSVQRLLPSLAGSAATQAAPRPQLKVVFAAVSGPAPEKQEDFHVMFRWYGAVLAGLYLVPRRFGERSQRGLTALNETLHAPGPW